MPPFLPRRFASPPTVHLLLPRPHDLLVRGYGFGGGFEPAVDAAVDGAAQGFAYALWGLYISMLLG